MSLGLRLTKLNDCCAPGQPLALLPMAPRMRLLLHCAAAVALALALPGAHAQTDSWDGGLEIDSSSSAGAADVCSPPPEPSPVLHLTLHVLSRCSLFLGAPKHSDEYHYWWREWSK